MPKNDEEKLTWKQLWPGVVVLVVIIGCVGLAVWWSMTH